MSKDNELIFSFLLNGGSLLPKLDVQGLKLYEGDIGFPYKLLKFNKYINYLFCADSNVLRYIHYASCAHLIML